MSLDPLGATLPHAPSPSQSALEPLPLEGLQVVPPDQEARALNQRMDLWNSSLKPQDPFELWLEQGLAQAALHTERLHQQEILLRHAQAQRALLYWDHDRRLDAEALAAGLMRHPGLVIPRLRRTAQGCQLLAERWDLLRHTAEARGAWTAPQRLLALNLLGIPPELRDAATPLEAPAGADTRAHLVRLAAEQARRHRDLAATLAPIDALEKAAACAGLAPPTPELKALHKEARSVGGGLSWYRSQFHAMRNRRLPQILAEQSEYTSGRKLTTVPTWMPNQPNHPAAQTPKPPETKESPPNRRKA